MGRQREVVRLAVAPAKRPGTDSTDTIQEAIRRAGPAVVQVEATFHTANVPRALERILPDAERELVPHGQGSGVIINGEQGYIISNAHVVTEASRISVTLADGRRLSARLVGSDPFSDLALIKVNAARLPQVVLGNSEELPMGSWLVAIGNPFGLENSATVGVLSAKWRDLDIPGRNLPLEDLVQTDAAINRGNSGGALVNLDGELIGIPTAIVTPRIGQGVGFAVSVERVKRVVPQLIEHGKAIWPWLGLRYAPATAEEMANIHPATATGMKVMEVMASGPAAKANLRAGDIVAFADGKPLGLKTDWQRYVRSREPGARVMLRIWRKGQWHNITVVLEPIP
jgi:S1-C subfamily serine protease